VSEGLIFCTSCGLKSDAKNEFCTGCGARLKLNQSFEVSESPAVASSSTKFDKSFNSKTVSFSSRKSLMILVAAVLISFVVGAGLASENVFSGIVGNRYTEKRLKNEKNQSYDYGYDSGYAAGKNDGYDSGYAAGKNDGYNSGWDVGYQRGDSDGFSEGYGKGRTDGCNNVFDEAGADQIIAIFYPYRSSNLGRYYWTRSSLC